MMSRPQLYLVICKCLQSLPGSLSGHPHGRWSDGSPVENISDLLDIEHCVRVLVRGGDLQLEQVNKVKHIILS